MKKRIIYFCGIICFIFVGAYFLNTKEEDIQQFYLKTVVYRDDDNMLIPVSLNFYNEMDIEEEVINRVDMMKSDELSSFGLHPIFSDKLEVNHVDLNNKVLTIDFNDHLYANNNSIDILEALSYTLCDYEEVDSLHLQMNGEDINHLSENTMPIASINSSIGLNNFVNSNQLLHHTYPVTIYHQKTINNKDFYVPITTRISELDTLENQISHILKQINSDIICNSVKLDDKTLNINLDSSVLLEDGTIDKDLFNQINLSLSTLKNIDSININIDNEELMNEKVSSLEINYIKL